MQPPLPPPEVSSELHSWLVELGVIKGKPGAGKGSHVLPGKFLANLASGEGFVELLNSIFERHAVKQRLTAHSGQPHSTWTQVAKGLQRLSVELDDAAVGTLASGDQALALELLEELHTVYQHWAAQDAKKQRRPKGRRAQPQQGPNGYSHMVRPGAQPVLVPPPSTEKDKAAPGVEPSGRHAQSDAQEVTPLSKERGVVSPVEPTLPGSIEEAADELPSSYRSRPDEAPAPRDKRSKAVMDTLSLSADRDFTVATSAPELLGLSMIQQFRITPAQAQELLSDNGRRLQRAFSDANERNGAHLTRWLGSLTHYGRAIAELLLVRPEHVGFTLTILGHGLNSSSDAGELACSIVASVCGALTATHLKKDCTEWLVNSSALGDMTALMAQRPASTASAVSVMVSCCGDSLLVLTAQYLKHIARGEQEHLALIHNVLRVLLTTRETAEACHDQGVVSHFLSRSLQVLADERSSAGTLQAAALLATDLWLEGSFNSSPQEGLGDLLAALKKATQSRQGKSPELVAFSCLSRLLSKLCDNQDPDGTPAVYRTLVYALVECESQSARDFGTRCLLALLEKYEGVPVGILAELTAKKFQVSPADPLAVIDVELFLVIAKHPRCTERHAEMLAQVLVRCAVENAVGRAASLPLLVIFRRFAHEDCIRALFERFVQVALTRLIQRGTPKAQINQVHELLAKVACMRIPSLVERMRQLLQEVCRAYLSNYMELHPNLQVLLELWPEDERELNAWVRSLSQESPKTQDLFNPDAGATVPVEQLAKETENLRDELASAKEKQAQALAEAEALRKELRDAKLLQKKVEAEVDQLQDRREEILAKRQAAKGDGSSRKGKKLDSQNSTDVVPAAEAVKVEELQKAFEEPLKVLFSQYAKPRRGAGGKRLEMRLEVMESMLEDLEISPSRLQKKAVPQLFKSGLPKPADEALLVENFLQLVPRLAKCFSASEATPMRDFGVTVPCETGSAPLELQAFLQYLEKRAETSHNSSLRVTKPVLARAKRRWVLAYAKKVLKDANARLAAGEDPDQVDLPEGFDIGVRKPPTVYLAPEDMPISQAERACVEILDEILARAVGVHFLEDASSGGPRPMAFIEGHEDLAALEPREDLVSEAQRHKRLPDHKSTADRNEDPSQKTVRRDHRGDREHRDPMPAATPAGPPPGSVPAHKQGAQPASTKPVHAARGRAEEAPQQRTVRRDPSARRDQRDREHRDPMPATTPAGPAPGTLGAATPAEPAATPSVQSAAPPVGPPAAAPAAAAPGQPGGQPAGQPPSGTQSHRAFTGGPGQTQPKAKANAEQCVRVREEERAKPRREHREPSAPPARSAGRAHSSKPPARTKASEEAPPTVSMAQLSPAEAVTVKRQRILQRHHTFAEEGKVRQEALQHAVSSEPVQNLTKAWEPNFRRSFEFFQRWKPSASGGMTLAGFLLMGECFGLLEKDDLKVAFKRGAGHELSMQELPNVLMHCVARAVEVECLMQGVAEEGPVTDEEVLQQSFADLCRHMMLNNGRALGKCLDAYRRAGHVLEQFTVQLPEKYIAERVTFEIDSNGILNVAAEDKGTGKSEKITITNDQGRLNEEQIQKMIREAEEFADEDKKVKERVDAKNAFDGYIHSMRSSAEGSGNNKGLSEKISSDEKETILDALKDARSWLDSNPEADVEEIKEKQKEVEGICAPIVSKYYGGGGGGGAGVGDDEEDFHDEL